MSHSKWPGKRIGVKVNEKASKENLYVSISGSLLHTLTLSLHNTDRQNNFVFIYLLEEGDVVHQCLMFTENNRFSALRVRLHNSFGKA